MSERRAWAIFERLQGQSATALTPDELLLVAVGLVRQEVNSGGFDSYFRYGYGDTALSAVEGAMAMGSPELAALIRQGMARLGDEPYQQDRSAREDRIDDLDLEFEDLDQSFYALEASVDLDAQMESLASRLA